MRTLFNVLWLIFVGWGLALSYLVAGVIACILIVTIPFGLGCFRLAGYSIWPFGQTVVQDPSAGVMSVLGNVLWFVVIGWWLVITQVLFAIALMITVIGIPFGIAAWKIARLSVNPLRKVVVDRRIA